MPTRFLPISWMSPATVPMTTRPATVRSVELALSSGSSTVEGALHGPGRQHHVGQVEVAAGEPRPDLLHAGHEALVDRLQGRDAGRDGGASGDLGGIGIAVDDGLAHRLELGVGHGGGSLVRGG